MDFIDSTTTDRVCMITVVNILYRRCHGKQKRHNEQTDKFRCLSQLLNDTVRSTVVQFYVVVCEYK